VRFARQRGILADSSPGLPSGRDSWVRALADIAKGDHNLRSDQNPKPCTHEQRRARCDVMQVARAFVRIAPPGPGSHNPCRYPDAEKNGSGIDRRNHEGHAEIHAVPGRRYAKAKSATIPIAVLDRSTKGKLVA
jgi:hypothetical protein